MKTGFPSVFVHFFALVFFVIASLAYFYPVLQGKTIFQSDIVQYTGMAKEQNDFRKATGEEPYWTNSAFGGMPTYQLGANYPHNYVKELDRLIRFLPRPADYLFLYLLGFYILLCCMKVDSRLAIVGALAFGFSTYLIIILGVGHNAKAHAIAYLPLVLGGIILTFRKKYLAGFALTAVAMALEISANHYQMTYYFMLLVLVLGVVYLIDAIRKKKIPHFLKSVGLLILAVSLGIAVNATSILATKEYADWSTRGPSSLTIDAEGGSRKNKDGLPKDYITQYSYGIAESLNLMVPRLFGGSNSEDLGTDSKTYSYLTEQGLPHRRALEFTSGLPLYWGAQPIVAAPAYIGAVVVFLFLLGIVLVRGPAKWWLLGGSLISLVLSWGKNFGLLTDLMIEYFPLYDKFRAVSSIQVILELCVPVLAVLGLKELISVKRPQFEKFRAFKISAMVAGGLIVVLFLAKGFFDFTGLSDATYQQYFGDEVLAMIRADRESVYISDLIRTLVYLLLAAAALWLYLKGRIKSNILIGILGLLILADLVGVDRRYVNSEDFIAQRQMSRPFQQTAADQAILQDSAVFRVYDTSEGLNGARTSYFHSSIGGYHAAKPAPIQDLFEFHVYKNNLEVLNMLNVKYIIQQNQEGQKEVSLNPDAHGNAWFVRELNAVADADEEILSLSELNTRQTAVFNSREFPSTVPKQYEKDSTALITLVSYSPNQLEYQSSNQNAGLAVFSEMYYPHGWQAYIDGQPKNHFRVNYALRAMEVPAGNHTIVFKFEPDVISTGSSISLVASLLLLLLILGGLGFHFYRKKAKENQP